MKTRPSLIYWSILTMILAVSLPSFGQLSTNRVDYQVTYDVPTGTYSVWAVPNYSTPNANNPLQFELGATAQVSLKVPSGFVINNITDVVGTWDKVPLKLGPAEQPLQLGTTIPALPAGTSYYVIGKGSGETQYGTFSPGVPVKLFTFTSNGCFGAIAVLTTTDDFVTVADNVLSLNTAPSFYSRSGQPAGGNQSPLEQYRAPFGPSANCLLAVDDAYPAQAAIPSNQTVLTNDQFNGVTPATSGNVQVTINTNPPNGSVTVNPNGTITYTANNGFAGTDTYTYTICDLSNLTVCSTATVTVTVTCPPSAAPTFAVTQPTCSVATGTLIISAPAMGAGISYTVTGPSPAVTAVNQASSIFTALASGTYTVTTTNASGCTSAPASFTVNPTPITPAAPTASVNIQPTCFVATGTITVSAPANGAGITYTVTGTNPVVAGVSNATGIFPGLASGNYNVTTTNSTSCTSLPTALVVNPQPSTPAAPTASVNIQPTCFVATGTITVSAPANGAGITYTVTGTSPVVAGVSNTTGVFSGLASGNYNVTTTNGVGCTSLPTALVVNAQPATPAAPTASVTAQPTCLVATGTITVTAPVNGAGISYTVTGTNPVVAGVSNATGVFPGLTSGNYNVTTTNGVGCTSLPTALVVNPQPSTPAAPTASVNIQPTCLVATGTITVTAPANGAGITYTVTGTNPFVVAVTTSTGVFPGLTSGNYNVTTTNGVGCTSLPTALVVNAQPTTPVAPTASVTAQPTCLVATGTITVTAPANGAGITYTVTGTSPVVAGVSNTTGVFSGLASGNYNVTTTNNTGCTSLPTALVVNPQPATPAAPTVSSPVTYCRNAPAVALTATAPAGATLLWYTVATGGTGNASAPTPPTTTIGSTTYYVASQSTSAGACESTRVSIVVQVLDCRVIYAFNDNNLTPKNTPVSGQVLTNDDINNGTGNLVVATTPLQPPTSGTVVLNANGTYTYTPNPNFVGVDSFVYRVCDQGSPVVCARATVYIKVYEENNPLTNNPPLALTDIYSTPLNTPVTGSVLLNDKDPDAGQTLISTQLSNPPNGTVTNFLPDGTFTYTPNAGFTGTDTFTYTACDNGFPTLCDAAVVQIEVKDTPIPGQNPPPVAVDDLAITLLNTPVSGNVSVNDEDSAPDPTPLTVNTTPILGPLNGVITLLPNGDYTYTPNNGFIGIDRVIYETCDAGLPVECARATLLIYVLDGKVALLPKAWLQGSLFGVNGAGTIMRDDLRVKSLIPLASPYPGLGFTALTTTVDIAPAVLTVAGNDAIVDWVYVELRSATNSQQVEDSRSALIQRDGDIVEVDGVSPITFSRVSPGNYYVTIKHRNHLGVMTQVPIALSSTPAVVDFRSPTTPTFRNSVSVVDQAQVVVDQGVAMWAGNALYDGQVIYQGTSNDVNPIYQLVISDPLNNFVTPFFKVKTYNGGDINMNGETVFQGTGNDIEFIYQNIIKNHPGNSLKQNFFIIREQLP